MGLNTRYLKTPSGVLKLFEIIFVAIAFSILRAKDMGQFNKDAFYFGVGVLVTCMIMTPLLLVCYLMGSMEIQQTVMEVVLNCVLMVLLLVQGSMAMNFYTSERIYKSSTKSSGIAMSFFLLAAAVTYFVDTILAAISYQGPVSDRLL